MALGQPQPQARHPVEHQRQAHVRMSHAQ
jgi:hypothetical protein